MTTVESLRAHGYVVLPGVLSSAQIDRIQTALARYLRGTLFGRNDFEGFNTERVYALLAKAPVIAELVEHPAVLSIVDEVLVPNYLLSANLAIKLYPGETRQRLHFDDGFYRVPRPRPAFGVSAIWAIDTFTAENGATEIIPGSHGWGPDTPAEDDPRIESVIMPAGSVLLFLGTLWHRGGANRSAQPRLAITPQYCEPWLRQIEQQVLAVPPELATGYSERIQQLLGYSIHAPFMGYVDGVHPRRLIEQVRGLQPGAAAKSTQSPSH